MTPPDRLPPRPIPDELWQPVCARFDRWYRISKMNDWSYWVAWASSILDWLVLPPSWHDAWSTRVTAPLWILTLSTAVLSLAMQKHYVVRMEKLSRQYHRGEGP